MSDVVAELASRVRLSDPNPGHCAGCFCASGPDVRFVDFDGVQLDRGAFVNPISMGVLDSIDELHLCEACIRNAAETLDLKPGLHRRQLNEIRRLELDNEHWKSYALRLEATLRERPGAAPSKRRGR